MFASHYPAGASGATSPVVSITAHFAELKYPRLDRTKAHGLLDILVIAICAIICGANDWEAVAEFGRSKVAWFKSFLPLPNGIPSHDTFWRVFRALDPASFQRCFVHWMRAVSPLLGGQVVAIDGKQLRRSHDKGLGQAAIYMVSAWATANRLVLGQRKVADKSNEITAIPQLLQTLDLRGCLVTIDAIGCQTAIVRTIIDQHADYLLALKANQGQLYDDVVLLFADLVASECRAYAYDHAIMLSKGHGRLERREAWTISDPKVLAGLRHTADFAHLTTVMMVRLNDASALTFRSSGATTSPVARPVPHSCCATSAATGASRIPCIGCSISPSAKMNHAYVRATAPRTSPPCVILP